MKERYIQCPYCGKQIGGHLGACMFCGKEIYQGEIIDFDNNEKNKQEEYICKNCKCPIEKGEEECSHCGLKLEWNLPMNKYIEKLKKIVYVDYDLNGHQIEDKFNYYKNEVFYKNNIPSRFVYYFPRWLLVISFAFGGIILGIIPLLWLFGSKKPWNKFLLLKENIIGLYEKGIGKRRTYKAFFKKEDIDYITIGKKDNKNSVSIHVKGYEGWCIVFYNVYELDNLIETLRKYGYNLKFVDYVEKDWGKTINIIVWCIALLSIFIVIAIMFGR